MEIFLFFLIKPIAGLLCFFLVILIPRWVAVLLWYVLPSGWLKEKLFSFPLNRSLPSLAARDSRLTPDKPARWHDASEHLHSD